jgi:hypothetical protein
MFVHYYDEEFFRAGLKKSGFELLKIFKKEYNSKGAASTHLIFLAKRQ